MIVNTLLDHSNETHRIEAFYNALKLVGEMDVKPPRDESWFDDLYDFNHGPEDNTSNDDGWMDDLDEAA
jgi:hypothetical protein